MDVNYKFIKSQNYKSNFKNYDLNNKIDLKIFLNSINIKHIKHHHQFFWYKKYLYIILNIIYCCIFLYIYLFIHFLIIYFYLFMYLLIYAYFFIYFFMYLFMDLFIYLFYIFYFLNIFLIQSKKNL